LTRPRAQRVHAWRDVKVGFGKGYRELKDGFQQARQWVSDKIAPLGERHDYGDDER
jgi:hypothetical protein